MKIRHSNFLSTSDHFMKCSLVPNPRPHFSRKTVCPGVHRTKLATATINKVLLAIKSTSETLLHRLYCVSSSTVIVMKQKRLIKSRSGHHIELELTSVIGTNLDRLKLTSIAEKASIYCAGIELLHAIELSSVGVVALWEISDSKHRNHRSSSVFLSENSS